MGNWQDNRILDLFGIELPIIQAPMAGATTPEMVIATSEAGGLGSLPGAMLSVEQMKAALDRIRGATTRPINLNFFAHTDPAPDPAGQLAWRAALARYYVELGLDPAEPVPSAGRAPFNAAYCEVVEAYRPEVVSFHFGLPEAALLARVKRAGARVIASATTVREARWLVERGVDAVIAMGYEAGGHRGNFLSDDMSTQVGTLALVPQIVDAVPVPVIAAGGIADPRGVRAAFALGASAVQVGTAYLLTPEAKVSAFHRDALRTAGEDETALTNLFTGRPARGIANRLMREIGPMSKLAPAFPTAGGALAPLRAVTEKTGRSDFSNMWSGQAARLAREMSSAALTRYLVEADAP
ncbi:NAD(P)H-dependent flavin oxidoreductase [Burkholderia gladioli]|uniref:Nitronate monooxygenase n=1 Tax=Burkholderia gladioli TaxID=28095 RepID=A0AB38TVS1_BURGA|nr:nitronate monooxygenase [Burkholderia gladioli]MBU9270235.1 nitronate monooxygenase [Burkholderia gladioli]MBU9273010.1 nitronate monooxygenase [Burkholderia gladioli]MBU9687223.1 nitronate monooxygenase [Burkholderia gladioli]MCA8171222.1 nitronate monooxygenase [Burkholderia gladioli]PRE12504.1 2-nitropropane dioxygenase [Burkholderia gladioli]